MAGQDGRDYMTPDEKTPKVGTRLIGSSDEIQIVTEEEALKRKRQRDAELDAFEKEHRQKKKPRK